MDMNFGTRQSGVLVIAISVILLILMFAISNQLSNSMSSACSCEAGTCPMASSLPLESYLGFTMAIALFILGVVLLSGSKSQSREEKRKTVEYRAMINILKPDEKLIFSEIEDAGNIIFQSEIVEKTGFSKVKISRILDKMEAKGLIERRRRGMTNVVMLKTR